MIATPDEIAEALVNPAKRKMWDLNIETITSQANKSVDIKYSTSESAYQLSHQFINHDNQYLVYEQIRINAGQTTSARLYVIEEVENRPYFVRLRLYTNDATESVARSCVKNLNSMHNFIMCEDRPYQIVASLKLLQKPKDDIQKQFNLLVSGLAFGEMEDISEDDSVLASMTKGEQDNKGPELNSSSDNEEDQIKVPDESPIIEDMSTPKEVVDIEVIEDWETRFRRANYS